MNPDLQDPNLCICGEVMELGEEFCCPECEYDFYEVQALAHYAHYEAPGVNV